MSFAIDVDRVEEVEVLQGGVELAFQDRPEVDRPDQAIRELDPPDELDRVDRKDADVILVESVEVWLWCGAVGLANIRMMIPKKRAISGIDGRPQRGLYVADFRPVNVPHRIR